MEVLGGLVLIGCVIAVVVLSGKWYAQKMEPYVEGWRSVRREGRNATPQQILSAGKDLVDAARRWDRKSSARYASEVYRECLPFLRDHRELQPRILELGRLA